MLRRLAFLLPGLLISWNLTAVSSDPYPNEMDGLQFYARYLAPLRPGYSDAKQIVQVLGSDQGMDLKEWRIRIYFACTEDAIACTHGPRNDPLANIEMTPKHRIRFRSSKLSAAFSHSYGGVSEINISCDVYSDSSGLEYWVVSNGRASYRKGDLFKISYGPARPETGGGTPGIRPK